LAGRTLVRDDPSLEFELEPISNGGGRSELRREIWQPGGAQIRDFWGKKKAEEIVGYL
jgi:hypothetical protein